MLSRRAFQTLLFLPLIAFSTAALANDESEESDEGEAPVVEEAPPSITNARRVSIIHWKDHVPSGAKGTRTLSGEDEEYLSIESRTQTGGTTRLLQIGAPPITSRYYALKGEIRYQAVSGTGYLELLSHFPGEEGEHFARTQAEAGPMKRIEGRSRWRTFWIPFNAEAHAKPPDRLTLNLVLASVGKIEIGPLELYEFTDAKSMMTVASTGDDDPQSTRSLSSPERRLTMSLTLIAITGAVAGIHFWHLRRERRRQES